jgi:hypothetical protein
LEDASTPKGEGKNDAMILNVVLQAREITPLPAEPPIGGPFWSYVVPAVLLIFSSLATYFLYRHFAKGPEGEG